MVRSRFSLLFVVAILLSLVAFAGVSAQDATYQEAPMLAELVAAGELPPLEERLPAEPLVVEPQSEVGTYGGTMRFAEANASSAWSASLVRQAGLFRYNQTGTEVSVDIAKDYSFNDDLTELTLELREGHKWSDGQPFTVDDILFWWEDIANNPELSPNGPPGFWKFTDGELPVFEKVSDTLLKITFPAPFPIVIDRFGRTFFSSDPSIMAPKHYLQKWHADYNEDAAQVAADEGFESWVQAFNAHFQPARWWEIERPWLWKWIPEEETADRLIFVRNPYYHAVDTEGNQLPYIDRISVSIITDQQTLALRASSGELDFESYYINIADMPVFRANEEAGNYKVAIASQLRSADLALMPNRTVKDPILNELFNNKDFRIALSLGINRERMNETLYFGLGTPYPAIPLPSNSYIKPEWTTMYIDYDPDQANALLDGLGLTERDGDGFRLRPDGDRLSVLIEIGVLEGNKQAACELVADDYVAIGIEVVCRLTEGSLFSERNLANEFEIATWHLDRAVLIGRADPLWFGFKDPSQQRWAAQWVIWMQTNGAEGVEPPQEIKDLAAIFNEWQTTIPGSEEFIQLGQQYFEYFATEIPMIGTVGMWPQPVIVSNRLHNVQTEDIYWGADTNFYAPYQPEQWYISE